MCVCKDRRGCVCVLGGVRVCVCGERGSGLFFFFGEERRGRRVLGGGEVRGLLPTRMHWRSAQVHTGSVSQGKDTRTDCLTQRIVCALRAGWCRCGMGTLRASSSPPPNALACSRDFHHVSVAHMSSSLSSPWRIASLAQKPLESSLASSSSSAFHSAKGSPKRARHGRRYRPPRSTPLRSRRFARRALRHSPRAPVHPQRRTPLCPPSPIRLPTSLWYRSTS